MTQPYFCYTKNKLILWLGLISFLVLSQNPLHAQNREIYSQNALKESQNIQKSGMIVLGSWATLNIFSGSVGFFNSSGSLKYFHQMNTAWNLVNLGIAGFGYRGATRLDLSMDYNSALKELQNFERILFINTVLDLAYVGTGVWLWKRGLNKSSDRQIGYGKSLVLQGGFLLAFDAVLYLIHQKRTQSLLQISENLQFNGNSLVLSF
jgi:hypothetical protein